MKERKKEKKKKRKKKIVFCSCLDNGFLLCACSHKRRFQKKELFFFFHFLNVVRDKLNDVLNSSFNMFNGEFQPQFTQLTIFRFIAFLVYNGQTHYMEWIDNHFFFTILIIAWSTASAGKLIAVLTGGNWQKCKRVFLTYPCHKIYWDKAVGLKSCKYT